MQNSAVCVGCLQQHWRDNFIEMNKKQDSIECHSETGVLNSTRNEKIFFRVESLSIFLN